ncbi:MAG: polyketide cyclase [Gammaproteobacteria bacterium]|nr:polyketide cyclase [Gammaproteobacteria bacterium]
MKKKTFSKIYSGISKEKIWQLWTNIDQWPRWNPGIDSCKLHGPFAVGSHFTLKPKSGPEVNIEIVEVDNLYQFTDCTQFPGAKLYGHHEMVECPEGLKLTTAVTMTGEMADSWWQKVGAQVAEKLPAQTDALVALAKS